VPSGQSIGPRLVIAALAALSLAARDPDLERGLELFERLEYDRAIVVLQRALARPTLPLDERARALETVAFAYSVLDDRPSAERAFQSLLDVDPRYEVPASRSPRLRQAFQAAKQAWTRGRVVEIEVRLTDDEVHLELTGDPERRRAVRVVTTPVEGADAAGEARVIACVGARCDAPRPREGFVVEVLDHRGARLAVSAPQPPRPRPPEGTTWLWVALGAAAALGGAIAIGVAAQPQPPEGTLGRLPLP
jgi:hypothetical protein